MAGTDPQAGDPVILRGRIKSLDERDAVDEAQEHPGRVVTR